MIEQNDSCVYFEGGGGGIEANPYSDEKENSVDMETREWDYQIQKFARKVK